MLGSRRFRFTPAKWALASALTGVPLVLLGACSALDRPHDSPSTTIPPSVGEPREPRGGEDQLDSFLRWLSNARRGASAAPGGVGWIDGYIPDRDPVSPFDADHPAVAHLEPALLDAIQAAARDAARDGIELRVSSGWRSAQYQQVLLDEAIKSYGDEETARRFVNTPDRSAHVTGEAVDVAPTDAMSWLSQHGSGYGLCQTYANELWHYELMIEAGGACPRPLEDASVNHESDGPRRAGDHGLHTLEPHITRP